MVLFHSTRDRFTKLFCTTLFADTYLPWLWAPTGSAGRTLWFEMGLRFGVTQILVLRFHSYSYLDWTKHIYFQYSPVFYYFRSKRHHTLITTGEAYHSIHSLNTELTLTFFIKKSFKPFSHDTLSCKITKSHKKWLQSNSQSPSNSSGSARSHFNSTSASSLLKKSWSVLIPSSDHLSAAYSWRANASGILLSSLRSRFWYACGWWLRCLGP